jgi:hypothetical protein
MMRTLLSQRPKNQNQLLKLLQNQNQLFKLNQNQLFKLNQNQQSMTPLKPSGKTLEPNKKPKP